MSYGTYDNQSPLNQPFNPTANTGVGNDIGRSIGDSIASGLFGQNAQGPFSTLARQIPGMAINAVSNLPGAPSPEAQQKVQQSQQGGGILKLRQQPPMFNGGKSGGGKYATPFNPNDAYGQPGGPQSPGGKAVASPAVLPPEFEQPTLPNVDIPEMYSSFGNAADRTMY